MLRIDRCVYCPQAHASTTDYEQNQAHLGEYVVHMWLANTRSANLTRAYLLAVCVFTLLQGVRELLAKTSASDKRDRFERRLQTESVFGRNIVCRLRAKASQDLLVTLYRL